MSVIEFSGVRHGYGDRAVLRGVDLVLTERRIGIVGANGSGKSTLARMVNGLVDPDRRHGDASTASTSRATGATCAGGSGSCSRIPTTRSSCRRSREDVAFSLRRLRLERSGCRGARRSDARALRAHRARRPPGAPALGRTEAAARARCGARRPSPRSSSPTSPRRCSTPATPRSSNDTVAELDEQLIVVTHRLESARGVRPGSRRRRRAHRRRRLPRRRARRLPGAARMIGVYVAGRSLLHRAPAGAKLIGLAICVIAVALLPTWWSLAIALAVALAGFALARIPARLAVRQLVPVLWILAIAAPLNALFSGWESALVMSLRVATCVALAALVTLTTTGLGDARRRAARTAAVRLASRRRPRRPRARAHHSGGARDDRDRRRRARGTQGEGRRTLGARDRRPRRRASAAASDAMGEALIARGFDD